MTDPRELKALEACPFCGAPATELIHSPIVKDGKEHVYHEIDCTNPACPVDAVVIEGWNGIEKRRKRWNTRATLTEPREWTEDEVVEIIMSANEWNSGGMVLPNNARNIIRALAAKGVIKLAPEPAAKAGGEG